MFSVGVLTLTGGNHADARRVGRPARAAGTACVVISALMVVYGLYLIIPRFH